MKKFNLSAPWVDFYRELEALFDADPEIEIDFNEDENVITLKVDNTDKAEALTSIIPSKRTYGDVTVYVRVVPANKLNTREDIFRSAFKGNPNVSRIVTVDQLMSNSVTYVAFYKQVVQYPLDNLHDINGNKTTLHEEIARDVIGESEGVCFCTDKYSGFNF